MKPFLLSALGGILLLGVVGCSTRSHTEFIPAENRARQALDETLTAWKNGQPPPAGISFGDARWQAGAKLAQYEIVEAKTDEGAPWFTVKLTMQAPAAEKTVRYQVFGNDPLQVYSEEAVNKMNGM
jgi:hypothetical protein